MGRSIEGMTQIMNRIIYCPVSLPNNIIAVTNKPMTSVNYETPLQISTHYFENLTITCSTNWRMSCAII